MGDRFSTSKINWPWKSTFWGREGGYVCLCGSTWRRKESQREDGGLPLGRSLGFKGKNKSETSIGAAPFFIQIGV